METEIPENINQAQSTTSDPSIAEQFLDSVADNALYHAFDSAVDKVGDVVDKIDVSDAAGEAAAEFSMGFLEVSSITFYDIF